MPHDTPLIATIVAGLALAFVFGAIAHRLRISPLVGYLLAGIAIGPYTPGFVGDQALANELAEIGVILLMFGVGLHFSLKELWSVRKIAIPGAVAQIALATLLGLGLALALGWTVGAGIVFGLALSVASTVVLLRALQERRLVNTERGHIAVGWLVVEDIVMVLTLVLLPALAPFLGGNTNALDAHGAVAVGGSGGAAEIVLALFITIAKVGAFFAVMIIVGRRVIPWILHYTAHTGSRELFRLAVLTIALGVAFGAAKLFGVSFALGAFFAGMILSESELSQQAANEIAAAPRCFRGAVLRLGRHAVRPGDSRQRDAGRHRDRAHYRVRQVARRTRHRAGLRLSARHGAHDFGQPGADRRVLVHSGRARHEPRAPAGTRARSDPGRSDPLDPDQSAVLRCARSVEAVARKARWLQTADWHSRTSPTRCCP